MGARESADTGSEPVALILEGTVVTMQKAHPVWHDGVVYVGDDGLIEAVGDAGMTPPSGFEHAHRVATDGVIYPGLVDLHSHIGYNTLPLWTAASAPFKHHDSWPGKDDYDLAVTWPYRVFSVAAPEAVLKYAEVKAMIGGTTAIQGKPRTSRPIDGWLVRVIDDEQFGQPGDFVHVATIPKVGEALDKEATRLQGGHTVYIPHVGEGVPGTIVHREFNDLDGHGCVQAGLIGIHATALTAADFAKIGAAGGVDRLVAVLEPLAVPRHHRRPHGPAARRAGLPRLGLVAERDEALARRAEGGRPVEQAAAEGRSPDRSRALLARDVQSGRRPGRGVGPAHRPSGGRRRGRPAGAEAAPGGQLPEPDPRHGARRAARRHRRPGALRHDRHDVRCRCDRGRADHGPRRAAARPRPAGGHQGRGDDVEPGDREAGGGPRRPGRGLERRPGRAGGVGWGARRPGCAAGAAAGHAGGAEHRRVRRHQRAAGRSRDPAARSPLARPGVLRRRRCRGAADAAEAGRRTTRDAAAAGTQGAELGPRPGVVPALRQAAGTGRPARARDPGPRTAGGLLRQPAPEARDARDRPAAAPAAAARAARHDDRHGVPRRADQHLHRACATCTRSTTCPTRTAAAWPRSGSWSSVTTRRSAPRRGT